MCLKLCVLKTLAGLPDQHVLTPQVVTYLRLVKEPSVSVGCPQLVIPQLPGCEPELVQYCDAERTGT